MEIPSINLVAMASTPTPRTRCAVSAPGSCRYPPLTNGPSDQVIM